MDPEDEDYSNSKLRLEVIDVTSTAVTLSVYTPFPLPSTSTSAGSTVPPSPASSTSSERRSKPPLISIQLDRRPWPHVAHAGSISTDSLVPGGKRGAETTVLVYGLDPARDYEISLDVVGMDGEDGGSVSGERTTVDVETMEAGPSTPGGSHELESMDGSPSSTTLPASPHTLLPTEAPPPYSAVLPSFPPNESQLRALLKKIRTSSKRTETVLHASISALKKSVDKSLKEDQRARTRIVGLEETIRKARENERDMRTVEKDACEESIDELEQIEKDVKAELLRIKSGKRTVVPPVPVVVERRESEEGEEEEGNEIGVRELAKELDSLQRRIDEAQQSKKKKAKEMLRSLEVALGQVEGSLIQFSIVLYFPQEWH
jgi:hypothetical protein